MNIKRLKKELFYLRLAFFMYKKGPAYLYWRYIFAPKVFKNNDNFEKKINESDLSVHILTSQNDLLMLMWSLKSFYQNADIIGSLYIHSDGSLSDKDVLKLKKHFPSAEIIKPENITFKKIKNYQAIFSARSGNHPVLLKKLIDPYLVSDKKYCLIIDSDLLWFSRPNELNINEADNKSLMMSNYGQHCYVYYKNGKKIDNKLADLNSGVVLYKKDNFNLNKLNEYFVNVDILDERNSHFIEQAGYAYCLKNPVKLAEDKYVIKQPINDNVVVSHYTSPLRVKFYIQGLPIINHKP